jgi:hypothetical protein
MVCVQLHIPEIKFNFVDFSFRVVTNTVFTGGVSLRSLTQNEGIILGIYRHGGPGSVVGIATGYGLDSPGIQSRRGRDFSHLSRPVLGPTSLLYNRYRVFPGGEERPGRDADPSPLSSTVVMKE